MIRLRNKDHCRIRRASAAALISMVLAGCGGGGLDQSGSSLRSIYVAWQPHPDPSVTGYTVYFGPTISTATAVASDQPVNAANFDPLAPFVTYDVSRNLGLRAGDTVCFRLKAYSADGETGFSPGTCTQV